MNSSDKSRVFLPHKNSEAKHDYREKKLNINENYITLYKDVLSHALKRKIIHELPLQKNPYEVK